MVYQEVSSGLQNPLARERKEVIEVDLESVVVILGEESKCLIPLVSNFDPLLRDFDKVLTELAQTEVACGEYRERYEQGEMHIKTLKQQKKSLELRIVELEALHQAELRRWSEEKKKFERRIEDFEWKLDQRELDMQRLTKVNTDLQKQLASYSEQLQNLKKARNITRKFSSAVRMVKQQKDNDVTQKIIKKLEEDSEQYTDRFNMLDNENSALARQLEEAHDLVEEMRRRDELLCNERREWKVEREDLLEESAHVRAQMHMLEADLNKHYTASKNLQSQIRKSEAEVKSYEAVTKKVSDENQLLESQMARMKNILTAEKISLDNYPELSIKMPDRTLDKRAQETKSSSPLKDLSKHEISLQDELDLEGVLVSERLRQASDSETLEMKNTQLEQELLRVEIEKNGLMLDVLRAEKVASNKDKEITNLKDEIKSLSAKIMDLQSQLEAYEEQRRVMEDHQMKLAERFVRDSRARRSIRRSNSTASLNASDNEYDGLNDGLFDENMQLIREKQTLFTKYTQLEAKSLEVERTLKDQKTEAERKLKRLEEDYSAIMASEQKLTEQLKEITAKFERLKCLYILLQSEDNEGEDPEELVARLKYKRGEVEALLRDRTKVRTQIVSLQKMINLKASEDQKSDINSGGVLARVMGAIRKRRNVRTVGALGTFARPSTGVVGKDLGYSLVERGQRKRTPRSELACLRGSDYSARKIEELKELSSVPRKISNGWTYSPAGIFAAGLPSTVPVYSKLLMLDDRPQRVICTCFVPHWPFPRLSGVKILLDKSKRSDSADSNTTKTSFEGRDSSSKSKDSSSRGSIRSLESKDSIRSTRSMDGKSNFPLIEEAVLRSDNVAMGMLCMSSLKPLTCMALDSRTIGEVSTKAEDRMSAALFSQDVLRNSLKRGSSSSPCNETQTRGESSVAEYVDSPPDVDHDTGRRDEVASDADTRGCEVGSEEAEMRRELFRQTKDAFFRRPVSSFRHKVSQTSRSLYPFLWVVSYADEDNLSFLHVLNLNFPARVTRTIFLCESKVLTMAVVKNRAADDTDELRAKKVLFGTQRSGEGSSCWMGTSDGRLFIMELREPYSQVYSQHLSDSVLQILHVEPHVYVSLHNGALVVYARDKQGLWDMENYQLIVIDTTGRKVRKIAHHDKKVWCGSGPTVSIYNTSNFRIDEKVDVVIGNNERIREITHIADTVWISLSNSTKIVIFSSKTKQILRVISLKGYLLRTGLRHGLDLQHSDLYITTIFYDGHLIWIGTNIGVVLSVMFPINPEINRSPTGASHLSSVDDELSWDPGDKVTAGDAGDTREGSLPGERRSECEEDEPGENSKDTTQPQLTSSSDLLTNGLAGSHDGLPGSHDVESDHHHVEADDQTNSTGCRADERRGDMIKSRGSSLTDCSPGSEPEEPPSAETHVQSQKDGTFDYSDEFECETIRNVSPTKYSVSAVSNMSEEIQEMIASFDMDSLARQHVQHLNEEHILFSVYGNQGPVSCFCSVVGDEEIPSLLCAAGIGFDDYEVKGRKSVRRKDCIEADSPSDPRLLAQLLMWCYSK